MNIVIIVVISYGSSKLITHHKISKLCTLQVHLNLQLPIIVCSDALKCSTHLETFTNFVSHFASVITAFGNSTILQ